MTAIAALPPVPAAEPTKPPKSRLFSNSVAMGLANVVGRGIGYGYILLMARRLDARYLGAYGILLTAGMLIELISNLGLDKILTREITRSPANVGQGYFRTAIPIRLTLGVLSGVVAWALLFAFFRGSLLASSLSIAICLSAILPVVLSRNCEAFLTAHERMMPIAISQLAEKAVILLAVLMLLSGVITFGGLLCFAPVAAGVRLLITSGFVSRMWVRHLPSVAAGSAQVASPGSGVIFGRDSGACLLPLRRIYGSEDERSGRRGNLPDHVTRSLISACLSLPAFCKRPSPEWCAIGAAILCCSR